jgi:hypothetical protein
MISQVSSVAAPSKGFSASSTPAAVATPLPPLKPKNSGHRWPTNAANPTKAAAASSSPQAGPNTRTSSTGT